MMMGRTFEERKLLGSHLLRDLLSMRRRTRRQLHSTASDILKTAVE